MLEAFYCDDCLNIIYNYGELTVDFMEKVCGYYLFNELCIEIYIPDNERSNVFLELVKILEMKNFITSTESSTQFIKVKPNIAVDEFENHLCGSCLKELNNYGI